MSSEYNGNILYVKDENGEWIPIPSITGPAGPAGPEGPQGPQGEPGEPGTTEWDDLEDKPFESIGTGLSVDLEGVLSAQGQSYTAGVGIDITNGVISCTLVDGNSEAY